MGEGQKAVAKYKCQINQFRPTQDFSRRPKANCCGGQSKMGTSESTAGQESGVVVSSDK